MLPLLPHLLLAIRAVTISARAIPSLIMTTLFTPPFIGAHSFSSTVPKMVQDLPLPWRDLGFVDFIQSLSKHGLIRR